MTARLRSVAQSFSLLRSRLSRRIALFVCLSFLLVEAAILIPSYLNLRSSLYDNLEKDVLTITQLTLNLHEGEDLALTLNRNWPAFQNIGVSGLAVFDAQGRMLEAMGDPVVLVPDIRPSSASPARKTNTLSRKGGDGGTVQRRFREQLGFYAILWPSDHLGLPYIVSARIGTQTIDAELLAFVLRIGGLVLILAAVVSAATITVLGREVLSPVLAIHRNLMAAHADPSHADAYKLQTGARTEIGETVTALNALLDRLANLRRSDLREQEQRFEDFAKSSSDWFWEMDRDLRFSFFSERFSEVTGVDERELLGKTRQETGIPGVEQKVWEEHLTALANHQPFRNFTHPREKVDGTVVWLAISGTPAFDEQGNFTGYRGTGRDITAEIELHNKLRGAKELAEAANRTKSEFLANMSHELRTPLNAIIGFSELMLVTAKADTSSQQQEYLTDIHDAAHHLLSLINDILDLSKIEAGASELNEEVVDAAEVAESVLRVVRERADKAGVALTFTQEEPLPPIFVDERKLKQALLNLLTNAIKFTEESGFVTLKIKSAADSGFIFQVADSGIGMAPEDVPKALRKFGQVDSDLNRRYEGTGLGLPLTKALIEMHQGTLEVKSKRGKGTTVTLRLPAIRIVHGDMQPASLPPSQSAAE
ncbi:PAS domain-containing sensor histidine kinase [Pelagibius sp.]|uniref:PAS domain-containing sensor histidine kinase n=1 Tax=Pelagibius sp. TaxID=1931238 RepID=UPI003BB13556